MMFFFSLHILLATPISHYLLIPADLGSSNGRAGKADEVMDGQQPAEPGDAMRRFAFFLGSCMACPNVSVIIFRVTRSSLASSRPLGSNIMGPGQYKISCLFLLGETRITGTVSKHQYGAHVSPQPLLGHDSFSSLGGSPSPWLAWALCVCVCVSIISPRPDQTSQSKHMPTSHRALASCLSVSRNGTIREPRSDKGGKSIAFTQSYATR